MCTSKLKRLSASGVLVPEISSSQNAYWSHYYMLVTWAVSVSLKFLYLWDKRLKPARNNAAEGWTDGICGILATSAWAMPSLKMKNQCPESIKNHRLSCKAGSNLINMGGGPEHTFLQDTRDMSIVNPQGPEKSKPVWYAILTLL